MTDTTVDEVVQYAIRTPNGDMLRIKFTSQIVYPDNPSVTTDPDKAATFDSDKQAQGVADNWTNYLRSIGGSGVYTVVTRKVTVVKPTYTPIATPDATDDPF